MSLRRIVVCADDFAASAGVSRGIARLCKQGRVSAVSCLSTSARWRDDFGLLRPMLKQLDVGLHLNLTTVFDSRPGMQVSRLLVRAMARQLSLSSLRDAIERQLDHFEDVAGCGPDHVDGHEHVHCFAQVRDVLLECLSRRYSGPLPYLRGMSTSANTSRSLLKRAVLDAAAHGFAAAVTRAGFVQTQHLAGLYGFNRDYRRLLRLWLPKLPDGALLVCHPAATPTDAQDPLAHARQAEFAALSGGRFLHLLQSQGICIVRGRDLTSP
ncbi:MAG: ChbG/HpnK family deacetylase [Rubrivivax sp.]|nr:ChbG/HpnK family deacetylase [Rubrivivax sp.]